MATENNLQKLEVNVGQGSELVELTPQEVAEYEQYAAEKALEKTQIEAEQEAKIAARESALAKLAALGLTEEEIASL
jgi:DNA-binding NarL/FixJ family response regulator